MSVRAWAWAWTPSAGPQPHPTLTLDPLHRLLPTAAAPPLSEPPRPARGAAAASRLRAPEPARVATTRRRRRRRPRRRGGSLAPQLAECSSTARPPTARRQAALSAALPPPLPPPNPRRAHTPPLGSGRAEPRLATAQLPLGQHGCDSPAQPTVRCRGLARLAARGSRRAASLHDSPPAGCASLRSCSRLSFDDAAARSCQPPQSSSRVVLAGLASSCSRAARPLGSRVARASISRSSRPPPAAAHRGRCRR